jgi:CubicO group peptidase (beta-lactamase class C family)
MFFTPKEKITNSAKTHHMLKQLAFLLLNAMLALNTSAQKIANVQDARFAGLDTLFSSVLKDWHTAGFAVAVVEKNKVVFAPGFGYRDIEKKLPVTEETLFPIGSCTKAFTAALMGLMRQDGKVEFDEPVQHYLPGFRFFNDALNNSVTLRSMMSHTTGLPRHDVSWYFFPTTSRDSMLQRVQYHEPSFGIRERWQYNNFMYALQGALAEKIYGKSWENLIREKFLVPLKMNSANFSISDLATAANAAIGYEVKQDSVIKKTDYYEINSMGPAGSINSSAAEMANWVMAWINQGKFNGKEIIPPSYLVEAISSQSIISPQLPTKEQPDVFLANYGFGWMLSSYRGHYRVEHGGNIDGFSASTSFYPTDSIGIVVLVNQNGSAVPSLVRNILSDRMLGLSQINWSKDLKMKADKAKATAKDKQVKSKSMRKTGTRTSVPVSQLAGIYTHPGYGTINAWNKGDSLFLSMGREKLYLRHYHFDFFEVFEVDKYHGIDTTAPAPFKAQFVLNAEGEVDKISVPFESGIKPIEFVRKPKNVPATAASLAKYVGDYDIMGTVAKVSTRNNKLYVLVPGQPEYELAPMEAHKFSFVAVNGFYVQFDVDAKGNTTAMTFLQPNGNFTATKK